MLSVAIKLDGDIVTMGKRVDIARLNGSAYTEILDKVDMRSVDFIENLRGSVRRPVVNDEIVVGRFGQTSCNRPDGLFLVIGRNNEEDPPHRVQFALATSTHSRPTTSRTRNSPASFLVESFSASTPVPNGRSTKFQNTSIRKHANQIPSVAFASRISGGFARKTAPTRPICGIRRLRGREDDGVRQRPGGGTTWRRSRATGTRELRSPEAEGRPTLPRALRSCGRCARFREAGSCSRGRKWW